MHKAKHLSTKPPHDLEYPTKPSHKLHYPTKHDSNYHFLNSRVKDPHGWIYKCEQYFEFKGIIPQQRVQLASFHLEEIALQWHWWFMTYRGPLTWEEFTKSILLRFSPTGYEDPSEALTRLKQTSIVTSYQEAFKKLTPCG